MVIKSSPYENQLVKHSEKPPVDLELEIVAFPATKDHQLSKQFVDGHYKILSDYRISSIESSEPKWLHNENVYVIIAKDKLKDQVIGGIRLHIQKPGSNIPLIGALDDIEPKIHDWVDQHSEISLGETCGLWLSRNYFGSGCAPLIARAGVALGVMFQIDQITTLVASYTLDLAQSLGFRIVQDLGGSRGYNYPTPEFKSFHLIIDDSQKLLSADESEAERIISIAQDPSQTFIETSQNKKLLVTYNMAGYN